MPEIRPLRPSDPERVARWRLVGVLGSGGQGTVYKAVGDDGREVAVKLLHSHLSGDDAITRGFLREVEAARRVAAFCTAAVLDVGTAGEQPYIVSEYVAGDTLQHVVRTAGPRAGGALDRLAISTLTALAAIHEAGIVHRDFKPGNVLMGPEGPIVIDFGIAKALDATTMASGVVGTPAYMSPEQFEGLRVAPASDVFSWAGTMVFAATGRPPFAGETVPAILNAVLSGSPDLSGVPERLAGVLRECFAKDPAARPLPTALMKRLMAGPSPSSGSPSGASPMGGFPSGASPSGASPSGASPMGGFPAGGPLPDWSPSGGSPSGASPSGASHSGASPSRPSPSGPSPSGPSPSGASPSGPSSDPSASGASASGASASGASPSGAGAFGASPSTPLPFGTSGQAAGSGPSAARASGGGSDGRRAMGSAGPGQARSGQSGPETPRPDGVPPSSGSPLPSASRASHPQTPQSGPPQSQPPGAAAPPAAGPRPAGWAAQGGQSPPRAGGAPWGGNGATYGNRRPEETTAPGGAKRISRRAVLSAGAAALATAAVSAFVVLRPDPSTGRRGETGTRQDASPSPTGTGSTPGETTTASATPEPTAATTAPAEPFGTRIGDPVPLPSGVGTPAVMAASGPAVASGTGNGSVVTWDLTTGGATVRKLGDGGAGTAAIAYGVRAGAPVIASGHADGAMRLWGPDGADTPARKAGDPIVAVTVAGGRVVAVSQKYDSLRDLRGTVRLWDVVTGRQIGPTSTEHFQGINGLAFGRLDGEDVLVTGDGANRVRVRPLSTGVVTRTYKTGEVGGIERLACGELKGEPVLVSTHLDATLRVYDLASGKRRKKWAFSDRSPDDRGTAALVTGVLDGAPVAVVAHTPYGGDAFVRVWSLADGEIVGEFGVGEGGAVRALALAERAGRPVVVTAGTDRRLRLWSLGPA
ncbi:protein kinase [Actinomadura sp. ATCC 31491]|uniref:non-specific serine/threonine protein kinase n=1 Tax=Actinomadura luzonensis TaxID=2805427 RepID=A0ABT0FVZ2_9ACTN|nr:serine/threonine-protein kinase [Actinomadura luzonensis]MCK2216504.1 protein kinase [Actinomadura luzonensis]